MITNMKSVCLLLLSAVLLVVSFTSPAIAATPSWITSQRSVTKIADGVYVIIHKDAIEDSWPQGNTTVIIGDREVFVVDACFLPSSAKEDIADIRKLTSKPVRYLLNTHFHIDHNAGNSAYMDAFPGLIIIAQDNTRRLMNNANSAFAANVAAAEGRPTTVILPTLRKELETGKGEDGQPLTPEGKARVDRQIAQVQNEITEYRTFKFQGPTLTFSSEMTVDLGNREIQIKHLGRGNTPGDALVYLPQDKILVTGDLLVWPIPYMRMSYPHEWVEVLRKMTAMNAATIVPGHGMILRDAAYLNQVIALLESVIQQVHEQAPKIGFDSRNKVPKVEDLHVDVEQFRKNMTGDDPINVEFWQDIVDPGMIGGVNQGVVGRTYAEEMGRL